MFVTSISFRGTFQSFWDFTGKSAILTQSALLRISQPDFQNQSISLWNVRLYESWVIYQNLNKCDRWFHLRGPRKFHVIFLGPNLKSAVTYIQILIYYSTFVKTNVSQLQNFCDQSSTVNIEESRSGSYTCTDMMIQGPTLVLIWWQVAWRDSYVPQHQNQNNVLWIILQCSPQREARLWLGRVIVFQRWWILRSNLCQYVMRDTPVTIGTESPHSDHMQVIGVSVLFFHLRLSRIIFTLPDRPSSTLRHWDVVEYSEVVDSVHVRTWSNKKYGWHGRSTLLPWWPSLQTWACPYVSLCSSMSTGDWGLFLGPLEWARAETGGADWWVL